MAHDSSPSPQPEKPPPLRSIHTANFPTLMKQLSISLLVSTYQAGKVVIVRADGNSLNTHFRAFERPMGLALADGRLAVGAARDVWEYRNTPAVCSRLTPPGKHDACFLPRASHVTGDIQVHEMAFASSGSPNAEKELWIVNTTFSCLCTLRPECSFVPRWRPPFISALAHEDRCHLNGLGLVDSVPRFVTALGESDQRQGWRPTKRDGGILMDITTNEVILRGLSMPHSPRWHAGEE